VHLGKAARTEASGEELLNLLENDIKEQTQCIVDIYSRYLFETAVFEQSQNKFLMATDLKQMKYPSRDTLIDLGKWAMQQGVLTQEEIDGKLGTLTA
jgi:hypothetical protein